MENTRQSETTYRLNCVSMYRSIIRLRRLIFEAYSEGRDFSDGQVLALLVAMYTSGGRAEQALAKLIRQENRNRHPAPLGGAPKSRIDRRKYGTLMGRLEELSQTVGDFSRVPWRSLSFIEFKGLRGPRFEGRTRALFLDSILLFGFPGGYVHLLRDDLTLRLEENPGSQQPGRKRDRWKSFYRAAKAAEGSSKRIWMATHEEPPESPPAQWWQRVARQKGLTEEDAGPF